MPRQRLKLLRKHSSVWTKTNPVLASSEPALSTDTGLLKIGDGEKPWSQLEGFVAPQGTLDKIEAVLAANQFVEVGGLGIPNVPDPEDFGFKAWTFDYCTVTTNTVVSGAGTLHLARLRNETASFMKLSTLYVYVPLAGAGLTNVGAGFWDAAAGGAKLAGRANSGGATAAAFQATGLKPITFDTPVIVAPGARFYGGVWFTGTTNPGLLRGANQGALANVGTGNPLWRFMSVAAALTDTAPDTLGTVQLGANAWWMAAA